MTEGTVKRSCGACTACCKTHNIVELNSPSGEWCRHCVIGTGCSIYPKRPSSCSGYECFWLRGKGEDGDRPDRLKLVVDGSEAEVNGRRIPIVNLLEVERGARQTKRAMQLTKNFVGQGYVVRHHECGGGNVYYVPPGLLTGPEFEAFKKVAEGQSQAQVAGRAPLTNQTASR